MADSPTHLVVVQEPDLEDISQISKNPIPSQSGNLTRPAHTTFDYKWQKKFVKIKADNN